MTEYYVSNFGNDGNSGTEIEQPFLTINHAVKALSEGDTLYLRQGNYPEQVSISSKKDIVIRSYPGEHACIDGIIRQFSILDYGNWRPALLDDPQAHEDEYISTETFANTPNNPINRGAFLDMHPYARLITYMNLNDLRSSNETFEQIFMDSDNDSREGPELVVEECGDNPGPECAYDLGNKRYKPASYRYPWVYMGPGLWFNRQTHKVHIRLSHTYNNVPGVVDYTGETDPNRIRLAISSKLMTTLSITKCENLRLEDLSIRFGGDETMVLLNSKNLVFDHVRIQASRHGVLPGGNENTVFRHCDFDGGLPGWFFRTDSKVEYFYVSNNQVFRNTLGGGTFEALLIGNPNDIGIEIDHCEFHDAHDVYLAGKNIKFHHNWIHNLNDEGLVLDPGKPEQSQHFQMQIYQNVITKTLSAISFAGNHPKGNWYIYRNLIDLRNPTAGFRPKHTGDTNVWRFGHLIKMVEPDGPRDLFQNTFLVYAQRERASYRHYSSTKDNQRRRTFNNIFIAVNPDSNSDKPITFIPSPSFPGPTDGNDYHRIGLTTKDAFIYDSYEFNGTAYPNGFFDNLVELRGDPGDPTKEPSLLFIRSQSQYPPGYEANSIADDPAFRQFHADGIPQQTDDLRLKPGSPAIGKGVILPDDLRSYDTLAPADPDDKPDIGCFPFDCCPLQVGVDSRRSYPRN